jgi:hypothetical protein
LHLVIFTPWAVGQTPPFYQGKTLKIIHNDPSGTSAARLKTVVSYLRKHIPGEPTIVIEFIEGGGGRTAANHMFRSAPRDGLTMGALSSATVGLQVMRGRFHGTYPPNFNEGTHLISRKGPTPFQVVPFIF